MEKIQWANLSPDDFQMFCNALLTFEIGKSFCPFLAPGRDGGIDGLYKGIYNEKDGLWRFQYKFYKTPRAEAVRLLKSVIKNEALKINNENYFVFITNVELLPQEISALQDIFNKQISELQKNCYCEIWDGAKIFTLYLQFPLLHLWLSEGFTTSQLQLYKTAFSRNLNANSFDPSSLNNYFISRKSELGNLISFLNSDQIIALVSGEAGIGKTRLVIEFFKQVEKLEDWTGLVLINHNVEFDKLKRALTSNRNFVILIDDAHTYKPETIRDFQTLCNLLKNKVKLILTARSLEAYSSIKLIKEYEQEDILKIKLDNLSREETNEIFMHYLEGDRYKYYINELITISFGKPILIMAILNAIYKGAPINELSQHEFLKNYVHNYFKEYYSQIQALTNISFSTIKRLLQNIVLIEPFNFKDESTLEKLCELHNISQPDITMSLALLIDNGFVNGRHEQSVKPDFYSDIILSELTVEEINKYLPNFISFWDNIIINLSSITEGNTSKGNKLNEILHFYLNLIDENADLILINKIISTIISISYIKPDIAAACVNKYISSLTNPNHIIYNEYYSTKGNNYTHDSLISKIAILLTSLLDSSEYYEFVFANSLKLYSITENHKLSGIFCFSKRDFLEHFSVSRQTFLVDSLIKKINVFKENESYFALQCMKNLLTLDFTSAESDAISKYSITMTTYFIPNTSHIKKLRKKILNTLFKLYNVSKSEKIRLEIIGQILAIPGNILATKRNNKPYRNDEEIKIIFTFLEKHASKFNLIEKTNVLEKLYWFQQWGIPDYFSSSIDKIKLQLIPQNLVEQISYIFNQAEIKLSDTANVNEYIIEKGREIISNNDPKKFAETLIEFLSVQLEPPYYFWIFINDLANSFPDHARKLYEELSQKKNDFFYRLAPGILSTLYFIHKDNEFYWREVEQLEKSDHYKADNILLSIYSLRDLPLATITEKDVQVIINIFNKKNTENNYALSNALQLIIAVEFKDAESICYSFLNQARQKDAENFFLWLSNNKKASKLLVSNLVLNGTIKFYLSYELERCLTKILTENGTEAIFNYLIKRFDYKKALFELKQSSLEYEFVPRGGYSHLLNDCSDEKKIALFNLALQWYLDLELDYIYLYFAKDLLEYLKPDTYINDTINIYFTTLIDNNLKNIHLDRVLEALSLFHVKDDRLINLVLKVFTFGYSLRESNPQLYEKVYQQSYFAITTVGVKTGTPGLPFQVDVSLSELLKNFINKTSNYTPESELLKKILTSVNNDITRSYDQDNLTW